MKKIFIINLCLWTFETVNCQDQSDKPTWENIAWMAGDWIGDGFGGISYEHWSPPIAGIMIGTYRHVSAEKNNFFEFFTIAQKEDGNFVMKLRHFNPNIAP